MAGTSKEENLMDSDDDLRKINGIGETRQPFIRQEFGVRTYREFAALTPTKVVTRFHNLGQHFVTLAQVEKWQAEAIRLATAKETQHKGIADMITENDEAENTLVGGHQNPGVIGELAHRKIVEANDLPAGNGNWVCLHRAFIVEFWVRKFDDQVQDREVRVRMRKINEDGFWLENGDDKEPSKIIAGEQLYRWMVQQLGEQSWSEPTTPSPTQAPPLQPPPVEPLQVEALPIQLSPVQTSPAKIKIIQIRAFQPPDAEKSIGIGQTGQSFQGVIGSGKPFSLEVSFSLTGEGVSDLAQKPANLKAQFYTRRNSTGEKLHLGDAQPEVFVQGQSFYTARLAQAILPPGTYRLQALVTFQAWSITPGFLEAPFLRVV